MKVLVKLIEQGYVLAGNENEDSKIDLCKTLQNKLAKLTLVNGNSRTNHQRIEASLLLIKAEFNIYTTNQSKVLCIDNCGNNYKFV